MKKMLIATVCAAAAALCAGTPAQDFKKGTDLLNNYKYAAAADTFDKIAQSTTGEMKNKAILYKALAMAANSKLKPEAVQPAIDAISDAKLKNYARMTMLHARRNWKKLAAEFDGEKINEWPEDYAYVGWRMRGEARMYSRMYDKAIEDLLLAEKNAGSDKWTLLNAQRCLFSAYCGKKDYEKAVKTIDRILLLKKEYSNSWCFLSPVIASADAYIQLKKYAEGQNTLAELDRIQKTSADKGTYGCLFNISLGKLYLAEGKKAEAKAAFEKAMACDKAHKYYRDQAQKQLDAIK